MKTETRTEIRTCLGVVLGHEKGDLGDSIQRLDCLREEAEGHLRHYLGKRSYEKAWILLEGGDAEKGICS